MILICLKCKNKMEKEGNYCSQCGADMSIYGFKMELNVGNPKEHEAVPEEEAILNSFVDSLNYSKDDFTIKKPSENYTTLAYKEYDIVRLKYTDIAKWVELPVIKDMKKKYIDNSLFEENTKNKVFWKSYLKSPDLSAYKEIIDYYLLELNKK